MPKTIPLLSAEQELRFWSRKRVLSNGCWYWTGSRSSAGYGDVRFGKRVYLVSRVARALHTGKRWFARDICHTCDHPPCFNPAHLFLGSHDKNMADSAAKGRKRWGRNAWFRRDPSRVARGEQIGRAILTSVKVRRMRKMYARNGGPGKLWTFRSLAAHFNVTHGAVIAVLGRLTWKHV